MLNVIVNDYYIKKYKGGVRMKKEEILNTKPENLTSEACKAFSLDTGFKKEYEKKWGTEVECK